MSKLLDIMNAISLLAQAAESANHIKYNDEQNMKSDARDIITSILNENIKGEWTGEVAELDDHLYQECSKCHKIRVIDDFCSACGSPMTDYAVETIVRDILGDLDE